MGSAGNSGTRRSGTWRRLRLAHLSTRCHTCLVTVPRASWYLDPVKTIDGHAARSTPTTPSIPLYAALARQLEDISAGVTLPASERGKSGAAAWRARFAVHERMKARTLTWAASHGLAPFPAPSLSAPTVSCINSGTIDAGRLIAGLLAQGEEIATGYGHWKGKTFRIGHMGDHTEEGLARLLEKADDVLRG